MTLTCVMYALYTEQRGRDIIDIILLYWIVSYIANTIYHVIMLAMSKLWAICSCFLHKVYKLFCTCLLLHCVLWCKKQLQINPKLGQLLIKEFNTLIGILCMALTCSLALFMDILPVQPRGSVHSDSERPMLVTDLHWQQWCLVEVGTFILVITSGGCVLFVWCVDTNVMKMLHCIIKSSCMSWKWSIACLTVHVCHTKQRRASHTLGLWYTMQWSMVYNASMLCFWLRTCQWPIFACAM